MTEKKRKYRKRQTLHDNDSTELNEEIGELLEIRKLKQKRVGINVERLLYGEQKSEPLESASKSSMLDSFTVQTNTLDANKHMMVYIESELKRQGITNDSQNVENTKIDNKDKNDPYAVPEHLRVSRVAVSEGNVTLSSTMLTAIPEVDLGIDTKLQNIENTERAKQHIMDSKNAVATDEVIVERFKKRIRR